MSQPAPIEDLAGLRALVRSHKKHDPATSAAGGMVITMLLALPIGVAVGTDASVFGGVLGGLGWWILFVIGMLIVLAICEDDAGSAGAAARTVAAGTVLAGVGWWLLWGEAGWVLPAALTAAAPIGGVLAWRGEVGRRAEVRARYPLGVSDETVAACLALPSDLGAPLGALIDQAIADIGALARFAGTLEEGGQGLGGLRGDVDRALGTMARRALVAHTMRQRGDEDAAEAVIRGIRRIGDELDAVTDAALEAAASVEGRSELAEHVENLRLTTASQGEIAAAVGEG